MHSDFARWHASVGIGIDDNKNKARWAGACSLVDAADRELVEGLTRLAFHARQPITPALLQKVREAFSEPDNTFPPEGNDRELEIMAGIVLAVLVEQDLSIAALAALGITTTALAGARKTTLPMECRLRLRN